MTCINTMRWTTWVVFLVLTSGRITLAQLQESCPEPSVAVYSCDPWQAKTDSANAITLSRTISSSKYDLISADTSANALEVVSGSTVDSITYSNSGHPFIYFPFVAPADSVGGTTLNYIIISNVSGTDGDFTLTVSLENGYTRYHIVDGTSHFSSATDTSSLSAASESAVVSLLPLAATIRNYEEQLRTANPMLCIHPEITVTPLVKKVATNASDQPPCCVPMISYWDDAPTNPALDHSLGAGQVEP